MHQARMPGGDDVHIDAGMSKNLGMEKASPPQLCIESIAVILFGPGRQGAYSPT